MNDIRFLFEDDYGVEVVKTKLIHFCLLKKLNDGDLFCYSSAKRKEKP